MRISKSAAVRIGGPVEIIVSPAPMRIERGASAATGQPQLHLTLRHCPAGRSGDYNYEVTLELEDIGALLATLARVAPDWQPELRERLGPHAADIQRLLGAVEGRCEA